ncbi:MAG: TRAP transporter small permease [Alphaproteobacteria bacterium]|nr:TRAP transporter small permease [Alphaproteobacteria bacterium]
MSDGTSDDRPRIPIKIEQAIGAAVMATIACITFANVVVRYLTNISFAFTEEYSVALMVIMALIGSAAACASDRHIRMTYFIDKLGPAARRPVEMLCLALSIVMFGTLAGLGTSLTWDEYRFDVLSPGLGVPQWLYTIWMPLLAGLCVLRLVGRLMRVARA